MTEKNEGLNMDLKKSFMRAATLFLVLVILQGCAAKRLEPWPQFMHAVIKSAQDRNYDKLTQELSLHRHEDIEAFYRQASILKAGSPQNIPTDTELYNAMYEDVKMFVRSYEDLFSGKPVTYSTRRFAMEGVDLLSVILWVQRDDAFHGILIHAVWQRSDEFKVLEWVYTNPASDPHLFKKTARLKVDDLQDCEFPSVMEFDYQMKSDEK
jgi:hypothetical protein